MLVSPGLRKLCKEIRIGPGYVLVPVALSLGAAVFEGISAGLLVPLLRGLIEGNFQFLAQHPAGQWLYGLVPGLFQGDTLLGFGFLLVCVSVAGFLRICLAYFAQLTFSYRLRHFVHKVRSLLFSRLLRFGKLYFDRTKQGEIHNVVLNFTTYIANILQRVLGQLQWFLLLIVYISLMLFISWELTVIVLCLFPVYHFSVNRLIGKIGKASKQYATADSQVSNTFHNVISCMALVKACGREPEENERFAQRSLHGAESGFSIDKKVFLIHPVQESITLVVGIILVCCIAAIVIGDPSKNVSGFLVYIYLLKRSTTAFGVIGDFRGMVASIDGMVSEIVKLLDDEDKFVVPAGNEEFKGLKHSIEFRQLDFSYLPEIPVLKDVSFSIPRGKVIALVGPSGSGKSTLSHLLLRFYDCPPSTLLVDGSDIRQFSLKSLRQAMAHVSQDTFLFNETLRYNISYGVEGDVSQEQLKDVLAKSRLEEYVASLPDGLDTPVGDRGVQLSGGEKQRVSIARAILRDPEILILDEATSSLDATTERLIQEALEELVREKTVVVIAHRFSTLKNADIIVALENGSIAEVGSLQELLEREGTFHRLWKEQEMFH